MAEINHAYELLSDPARRAAWDAAHPVRVSPPVPPRGAPDGHGGSPRTTDTTEPTLDDALAWVLGFGKYRGRTLGYVAAFEPGYIAWIVRTIDNRPGLLRHARVVLAHLEAQGWRDTPRPPRSRAAGAGAGSTADGGPRSGAWAGTGAGTRPTPPPRRRPAATEPRPRDPWQVLNDHPGAVGLGLTAISGLAWFAGISVDTISGLIFLVAVVGWPLWNVIDRHRNLPPGSHPTGFETWRSAVGEVVFVAILLVIGWGILQDALYQPQPGDIVCDSYDLRSGDCVSEHVYEGP